MGDLFGYMVITGIAGLAGSGVILILNRMFHRFLEDSESPKPEKDGSITTYSWDAANDLYMCHHTDCNKYSRFYQQRIAFLKFMVTQPANLKKPFVDNDNYRICPHCELNKDFENPYALMRSDAKWAWLETDPDCPTLKDSEDVKAACELVSHLRKAIRENEEIASFQQYHGVESESIEIMLDGRLIRLTPKDNSRTLDLSKKVDTITAERITIPSELKAATMPKEQPGTDELMEYARLHQSAMRNFGVDLKQFLEPEKTPLQQHRSDLEKLQAAAKREQEWAEWMRVNVYEKK